MNVLARLYCCMLIPPEERECVHSFLLGAAINGRTEGIRYHLWTLETGILCLAIPLDQSTSPSPPGHRSAACFCPVAPEAVDFAMLILAQKHASLIRHLANVKGIVLPDDCLLYVAEQPGERILSLKCESDSPSWELVRMVNDIGWGWQGYPLSGKQTGDPLTYPKSSWKVAAPLWPPLLLNTISNESVFDAYSWQILENKMWPRWFPTTSLRDDIAHGFWRRIR